MKSVSHWKMNKIIFLIVGFISFVQAAPNAEPCVIILPPPRVATPVTARPTTVTTVTTPVVPVAAPISPVAAPISTATVAPITPTTTPAPAPALTPEQLATLLALYNMYMEFLKTQPSAGSPVLPMPPPASIK